MTTFTVVFPHAAGTSIAVLRHYPTPGYHLYRTSLPSVLRLVRLATNKPTLVPHPSGVALEIIVDSA